MKIILASQSPRRAELMLFLTPHFTVHPSDYPEREVKYSGNAGTYTEELALRKALEVAAEYPEDLVLGSDTVVICRGKLLNKPLDLEEARQMIRELQGRWHDVVTSYALICLKKEIRVLGHVSTRVLFHSMTKSEMEEYLETGDHDGKAGAYAIQGAAARYIAAIEGDFYTVVGLPVAALYQELKKLGFSFEQ